MNRYVHGYTKKESCRLIDQANTLAELLHQDTRYPAGSRVLEAGCGIGAQTVNLVKNSPQAHFTCIDISAESLKKSETRVNGIGAKNAIFRQADIFNMPFPDHAFDHIFVCFVLEHLEKPVEALKQMQNKLKPGGSITVIEGDHGSAYFYPESPDALRTIQCLIDIQKGAGGNALIGRSLFPLLCEAGLRNVVVSPRMVYVDSSNPQYVRGFTENTFIAMIEGVREQSLQSGLIDEKSWDKGIRDLNRTTESDGVFCYTFFKATAIV
jgi:SAM-dependent methyltransferase